MFQTILLNLCMLTKFWFSHFEITMKNLAEVSEEEQKAFFDSFDFFLTDVDGVVWLQHANFYSNPDSLKAVRKLGKKVIFVSNNATKTINDYFKQLEERGYAEHKDDLVTPTLTIISHLKSVNLTKEIYLSGMSALRSDLEEAGFKVAEAGPDRIEENAKALLKSTYLSLSKNIGAVIMDADLNANYVKLQNLTFYLRDPNVIFLSGAGDLRLPLNNDITLIGPGRFHKLIEEASGRKPICVAKPHSPLKKFIVEKYNITDPTRVLFVGDSIPEDMGFAESSGFKKLLVLSTGLSNKSVLVNWEYPEEFKPEYYVEGLDKMLELMKSNSKINPLL